MAEENQQQVQQVQQEPQQVTTKNPKTVEAGKRLAAHNCRQREVKQAQSKAATGVNQYYGTDFGPAFGAGAVISVGVIGGVGYYLYQAKKGEVNPTVSKRPAPHSPKQQSLSIVLPSL